MLIASRFAACLALLLSAGAWSAAECSYGELTRTIDIVYSNPGQPLPCEVLYDKPTEGGVQTLYRAMHEAGYCEDRTAEFIDKLRGLGWQCSTAQESTAEEPAAVEPVAEEPEAEEAVGLEAGFDDLLHL